MSSSSLYGYTGNVTVSANNLTTLYNATTGNVEVASVPDRNFTTLYTKQSDISPTKGYGNANVEAFLNAGTDGANSVQNIVMSGNITVGSSSYLGNVGNVHITGGNSGYVLVTDGLGNLIWSDPTTGQGGAEYIHFDVTTTGNNQTFTNSLLDAYTANTEFNVMKNGVNIEPQFYVKTGLYSFQVNILLNEGDTIDVLAGGSTGGGGLPAGTVTEVQYNGGYDFAANSNFTYDEANSLLTVTNLTIPGETNLGSLGNVTITGGTTGYVIQTDGAGNLSWVAQAVGANVAGLDTQVQYNNNNAFGATSSFTYNQTTDILNVGKIVANGAGLSNITGANVSGTVANANFANYGNYASFSNVANISNISYSVAGSNVVGQVANALVASTVYSSAQPAITSLGNLTGLTSNGVVNFSNSSNVSLGSVSNVKITGGSANYYLKTDGTGNLSWDVVAGGTGSPGGSNTYVQFNDANTFGGDANFYYNKTSQFLRAVNADFDTLQGLISAEETVVFPGSTVTGTYTYNTAQSSVVMCTINTTGSFLINFTNLTMNTNGVRSFAFINKNASGTTYHCTGVSIGGVAQTVNWQGGSAPSTGGTYDIYNITIVKTTSAPTYVVFATFGSY